MIQIQILICITILIESSRDSYNHANDTTSSHCLNRIITWFDSSCQPDDHMILFIILIESFSSKTDRLTHQPRPFVSGTLIVARTAYKKGITC